MPWNPTTIRRPDKAFKTATDTVRVTTDAGPAYLKALGNHGSPHYLAADLVGTQLAAWLGLEAHSYQAVLEQEPRSAEALDALEKLYFRAERWEDLYGVYEKMVDIAPGERLV